ncbi:MAG: hypothetical protein AAGB31_12515 [Bdellovibrio sp.]
MLNSRRILFLFLVVVAMACAEMARADYEGLVRCLYKPNGGSGTAVSSVATPSSGSTSDVRSSDGTVKSATVANAELGLPAIATSSTVAAVSAASSTSTGPSALLGFVLSRQNLNNNRIAVAVYQLTDQYKVVKQIGYGELGLPINANGGRLESLESAEDSPFKFKMNFAKDISDNSVTEEIPGTAELITTFQGKSYSKLTLSCRTASYIAKK